MKELLQKKIKKIEFNDKFYLALTIISLLFIRITHVDMNWVPIILLAIFCAVYLKEKVIYISTLLVVLTIVHIITGNTIAYNFYFTVFVIIIGLSAVVELLRPIATKFCEN